MSRASSFTAASAIPYKVFLNKGLCDAMREGDLPPTHVQFLPTNRCNLHCSFCSCEKRERGTEMPLAEALALIQHLQRLGCQSVTITGGGEPLMHPDIGAIVRAFVARGMQVGLVTNGLLLDGQPWLRLLTWCRISCCDERALDAERLHDAITDASGVDWAFSYVLSDKPNTGNLGAHFDFAEKHGFTHVRVVADLRDPDAVPMEEVSDSVSSSLAIWQARTDSERGAANCLISCIKPLIGPDGLVYPCCGVQYAQETPSFDLTPDMAMGRWDDLPLPAFDGSKCVTCYYGAYNRALEAAVSGTEHIAFV